MVQQQREPTQRNAELRVSTSASALASRLQWLLCLLIAASLLSASVISYQTTHSPHLKRVAPFSTIDKEAQALVVKRAQTGATENDEEIEMASLMLGAAGDDGSSSSQSSSVSAASAESIALEQQTPAAPPALEYAGIPRIIHQSWKSQSAIPKRFEPWVRSWTNEHPTWTYVFWTDADNLALFETLYPQYLHVARGVGKIALADMARYALLHSVGGLYVDADFECVKPFDQLLRDHELFLSSEPRAHTVLLKKSESVSLCNALMASKPRHPFWLKVLDAIRAKFEREGDRDPVVLTGPRMLNQTYFAYFNSKEEHNASAAAVVLPPEFFCPEIAYWNLASLERARRIRSDAAAKNACAWLRQFPRGEFTVFTHATHHWQYTWCNGDESPVYASLESVFAGATSKPHKPQISHAAIKFVPMIF